MLQQLPLALLFYACFSLFALLGLVFTRKLFESFSLAYAIAKPLGFLIFGYIIWLLGSLKILDFQKIWLVTVLFIAIILAAAIYLIYQSKSQPIPSGNEESLKDTKKRALGMSRRKDSRDSVLLTSEHSGWIKQIIKIEILWLVLFFAYLWLRSYHSAISGTERFMDMMLFSASGHTNYFPPIDSWYAGKSVNYYYYGHYLFSLLANLTHTAYSLAYNFSLGIIFSTAAMLSGLLTYEISKSKFFAVLAGFFVTASGTVAYSFCVMGAVAEQVCSYASSTRLYTPSYIINEIPSYSFTVGDLHAHLLALPFFLTAVCLLYAFWKMDKPSPDVIIALIFTFAASALINPWDFVTLAILTAVIVIVKVYGSRPSLVDAVKTSKWVILSAAMSGIAAIILILPFLLHFQSGSPGFGFAPSFALQNTLPENSQYPSPFLGWIGMWLAFLSIIILAWIAGRKHVAEKQNFAKILAVTGLILLIAVEIFFVKDIYFLANPPFFRANTVFKFGFHTWTLLAISSMIFAKSLYMSPDILSQSARALRNFLTLILLLAFLFGLFYPYQAIKQFYMEDPSPKGSLDGLDYMKSVHRDDYGAIKWLQQYQKTPVVLIEAAGDSYSDYGRFAVFTGMREPINWKTHEWTWRFKLPEGVKVKPGMQLETGYGAVAALSDKVKLLYETSDIETARQLLREFNAAYVYVGFLEWQAYPQLQEEKFSLLGQKVFSQDGGTLYKISP